MATHPRPYRTHFLCTGNFARSILAEATLERRGGARFESLRAGSKPRGAVHLLALEVLAENGFDAARFRSKSWDELASAPPLHFVFTCCDAAAKEGCLVWPGQALTRTGRCRIRRRSRARSGIGAGHFGARPLSSIAAPSCSRASASNR